MKLDHERRIAFVGLGYVGLSTAVCLASRGFKVHGIDVDEKKLSLIRGGHTPIQEKGLNRLLRAAIRKKTLTLSSKYEGIGDSRIIFLTVGTPSKVDGGIDTEFVEAASKEVARQLVSSRRYHLVVVKSTVIPGTAEGVVRQILKRESKKAIGEQIGLASNPEFLHEGSAVSDTFHPDAIVIGGCDKRASETLLKMYESFYRKLPPTIVTSPSNAEMTKYAINSGRSVQLSFVNTIANLCTRIPGCDYDEVRKGLSLIAKMDERYLAAGMGFGGSCLPKDSRALASALRSAHVADELVAGALRINVGQIAETIRLAEKLCGSLDGRRVAMLGLAFKAGTDDIRESVAISLTRALIKKGAEVSVYDPVAMENARRLLGGQVDYARSARRCLRGAECAFIATGWDDFRRLRPSDFKAHMASPAVVDARRIYDQGKFLKAGVQVMTIGTGPRVEDGIPLVGSSGKRKKWQYTYTRTNLQPTD